MHHLAALDAPGQIPSSASERPKRPSGNRVSHACRECQNRKVKCDGALPCSGCVHNRIDCVYQNTEPSKHEKALTGIHDTLTSVFKEIRGVRRTMERSNRGHSRSHFISVNSGQEYETEAFSPKELHRLSKSYVEHAHPMHPIFERPQQMCIEFIDDPALGRGMINSCIRNVQVLLFFALGSCRSITCNTGRSSTMPGKVYYSYAKDILKYRLGEYNIPVAQALTLAALYVNQIGMLRESLTYLCSARAIYTDVVKNTSLSEETKRSFWIYQELECGINNCFNPVLPSSFPNNWTKLTPEGSNEQFPETVQSTRVSLRSLLNAMRNSARPHFPTTREVDDQDLWNLEMVANDQITTLESWKSNLIIQLAWDHTELPSTDPLLASLRAEYYDGMTELLRSYVELALRFHVDSKHPQGGLQSILSVLVNWERYALSSLICFDRVGAASDSTYKMYESTIGSLKMLSNPVSTLHTEFKTVFLFHVIRSSQVYPLIAEQTQLTDPILDILRRRTISRLSEFSPSHPILTQDSQSLSWFWPLGNPASLMNSVRVYGFM